MSEYNEHLISMAGGDGELSDALATLEDRVENGTMRPDDRRDLRLILNHISTQRTTLAAVLELANSAGRCGWKLSADDVRKVLRG